MFFSYAINLLKSGIRLEGDRLDAFLEWIDGLPIHHSMAEMRVLMYTESRDANFWRETILRWKSPDGTASGPLANKFFTHAKDITQALQEVLERRCSFSIGDLVLLPDGSLKPVVSNTLVGNTPAFWVEPEPKIFEKYLESEAQLVFRK